MEQRLKSQFGSDMLTLFNHPGAFRGQDVEAVRDDVVPYLGKHELTLAGGATGLDAAGWARRLRNVSVVDVAYGGEVEIVPEPAGTFVLIQISFAGVGVIRNGSEQVDLRAGAATAVDPTKPVRIRLSADCATRVVRFERSALEAHLRDILGGPLTRPLGFGLGMNVAGGDGRALLEDVAVFVQRLQSNPEIYGSAYAATMAEKNLMTRLLLSARHNYRDQLTQEPPRASTSVVRRSIDLIHGHPDWDHSVGSLAREVGVSARTLERAFRRDTATSPMAYLKAVRLDRAYDELRAAAPDLLSVSAVARRWGFVNRGRFAADYRQRHGEPPSATLRK